MTRPPPDAGARAEAHRLAAKRLRARAISERITQERGALRRDGGSARHGYAADVLDAEAEWQERCAEALEVEARKR